ncbi:MAG: excinuclease ABC subunit UvrC [Desulfobulbaceae bacterium]|nr:MAG: excinuclease ABC subunit UvrC [Desulfobulbaceae bacterium]
MFPADTLPSVPHSPGVYMMLDGKSAVLYVGKAKDLFKRLSSYARHSGAEYSKTTVMLAKVARVDTIITATEKEALILEASLIKQHKPRYNIILRDDKSYPLIRVTVQEEWPRVMMTRRRKKDGARYFGPYSSVTSMWATLKLITNLFPLRRCPGHEIVPRKRPCLNHQMGRCLAPCAGLADRKTYGEHVRRIIMVLEGRNQELIAALTVQMRESAARMEFEQAAILRDQIRALSQTLEKQVIASEHGRDRDVFGFARQDAAAAVTVLFVRGGLVTGSRSFFLADPFGDDRAILAQVLNQFYDQESSVPPEILLSFLPEDHRLLTERLSDLGGRAVAISAPSRGERMRLIEMAETNARQTFAEREKKEESWQTLAAAMQKRLHLRRLPDSIECLDISNISGRQAVGSLVRYAGGTPDPSRFRHYRIRTVDGPDDYAMMAEVLQRRLNRAVAEDTLPDLFVVDGGRGQLSMAMRVAGELGITDELDWIGIAKEREDEGEKLFKPGRKNPIVLPAHNPVLLYLMRIRDEAHRYGVTFHRRLRNRASLSSRLDQIPGIGSDRKKRLLRHLGSLKRIESASVAQLCEVKGIGPELAKEIHAFFHAPVNTVPGESDPAAIG